MSSLIKLKQLESGELGSFITGVTYPYLSGASGVLQNQITSLSGYTNPLWVLRTGDQTISGNKTFSGDTTVYGNLNVWNSAASSQILSTEELILRDTLNQSALDWNNRSLYNSGGTTHLDWQNRSLTGNWSTNGIATSSGHLINKGFFDSRAVQLTGVQTIEGNKTTSGVWTFNSQVIFNDPASFVSDAGENIISIDSASALVAIYYPNTLVPMVSNDGFLYDDVGIFSIATHLGYLYNSEGNVTLNYKSRGLSGAWRGLTGNYHVLNYNSGSAAAPSNTGTVSRWLDVNITGITYKLPLYL